MILLYSLSRLSHTKPPLVTLAVSAFKDTAGGCLGYSGNSMTQKCPCRVPWLVIQTNKQRKKHQTISVAYGICKECDNADRDSPNISTKGSTGIPDSPLH